ncbi:BAM_G0008540.mRNA.1.CDS.1 [Saccharomyces cerevisiae]|nr:BAM_G0008540.mRNA.1.CDS.1 [Saccharomyces cerevisiae]CAI7065401.1 BAM_G0008540.mRNA.1.CDS.1 [Saccharomyces cerevisiae]
MIKTSSILKNCNYRYIHCIHRCLLNEANLKDRKTHNVERALNERHLNKLSKRNVRYLENYSKLEQGLKT